MPLARPLTVKVAGTPPEPLPWRPIRRKRRVRGQEDAHRVAVEGASAVTENLESSLATECKRLRLEHATVSAEVHRLRLAQDEIVGAWLSETACLREERAQLAASAECQASQWQAEKVEMAAKLRAAEEEIVAAGELEERHVQELEELKLAAALQVGKLESERAKLAAALSRQRLQGVLYCSACTRKAVQENPPSLPACPRKAAPERPPGISDNRRRIDSILRGIGIHSILQRLLH